MSKAIYFDMDGTIVDFYGVSGWLTYLEDYDATPYRIAKARINLALFAKLIHKLQAQGFHIGIISWLSKTSSPHFDKEIIAAKEQWLAQHLPSVSFDEIRIVPYGTPKSKSVIFPTGYLIDDELANRSEWRGLAFDVFNINEVLKTILKCEE